jgi:Na+/melibiose symporter-like transporter
MADVDDYGEWKTGKRITGISFSGNLFFLKAGAGGCGAMVGFALLVRLRCRCQSAERQRYQWHHAAVYRYSGVGYLITAGVVRLLKVDRELMKTIQADLEKRRVNYHELSENQGVPVGEQGRA